MTGVLGQIFSGEDTVSISNRSAPHQRQRHRSLMELSDETDTRIILLLAGRASRLAIGSQVETREEGGRLGKRNGANEGEESSEWTLRHVESERRWLLFVHGPLQCLSITRAIPRSRSNKTVGRMKPVRDAQCSTALMHRPVAVCVTRIRIL